MPNPKQKTGLWKNTAAAFEELLFPKRCVFCKKYGCLLCADCEALFEISPAHVQDRRHRYLDDIYSACSYENRFVQKAILIFKYDPFLKEMALPLAHLIDSHLRLAESSLDLSRIVLAAVPLAPKRMRWRGYNQSEELAKQLGTLWNRPVIRGCLTRARETPCQADLSGAARRENVKGAFSCAANGEIKDKTVCLVDDVVTTGATMQDCARALKKSGAKSVIGISVARTENT
ncbi:MAG: hypothetical protein MUD10_01505 [Candidatus Pacebacteria bacterium]|jgi:ComF family protein|nr:hypothetical protein [Candidatus Paceibacterota bacterium]